MILIMLSIERLVLKGLVGIMALEIYSNQKIGAQMWSRDGPIRTFFSLSHLPSIHRIHRRHSNINLWYSPSKLSP
jgi:hypothetical protein